MSDSKETNSIPHWYLLYTNPRAEKKVDAELRLRGFDVFLPLHKTLRQWSDRKKLVEVPLFNSYIFIYTQLERNYYDILNVNGIVKFVNFDKTPAIVDPREIELIKFVLCEFEDIETGSKIIQAGSEVEVIAGALAGKKGKMIKNQGKNKVIIELESIQQSLIISMPEAYIRMVKSSS
ncbi:MAG: UpxY family transcription antiterminator [Bacteroidia bacterium]|nr:UpxY family transcription antiterminator [Bacteroidia bacterium]